MAPPSRGAIRRLSSLATVYLIFAMTFYLPPPRCA
jgi:hypothetical protein